MLAYLFSLCCSDRFFPPIYQHFVALLLLRVPAALFRGFDLQEHKMHDKPFEEY